MRPKQHRKKDKMQPITDAERISELAFGFMGSKALFAALHLQVFCNLSEGPKDATALAEDTGVGEEQLLTLLTVLISLGLLTKEGDQYSNAPASQDYLVRDAKAYFGDYLRLQIDRQMYPFMQNLDKVLKGDLDDVRFETYADWMDDAEEAKLFSHSQHSGSLGPGAVLAKRIDLSDARSMLDVGGGSGAFSIMMCKRYPEMKSTILDFPHVCDVGREYVKEAGLSDRIDFISGDGLTSNWPESLDVVLMSYLFSGVPGDAIPDLCETAFKKLKPQGHLIVHDFMVDDDREGPQMAALWALQHMTYTPGAVSITPGYAQKMAEDANFGDINVRELIPGMTRVMHARKPNLNG